jgi:hypothetical protein
MKQRFYGMMNDRIMIVNHSYVFCTCCISKISARFCYWNGQVYVSSTVLDTQLKHLPVTDRPNMSFSWIDFSNRKNFSIFLSLYVKELNVILSIAIKQNIYKFLARRIYSSFLFNDPIRIDENETIFQFKSMDACFMEFKILNIFSLDFYSDSYYL